MSADTVHGDVQRIGVRRAEAGRVTHFTGGKSVAVVHGESEVGLGEAGEQALFDHRFSAADALLGGLADINKSSVPAVFILHQQGGGSDADRDVQIVAAGVHHRHFDAAVVMRSNVA